MTRVHWKKIQAADFTSLLALIPDDALASPKRSVVPLIDFCRSPDKMLRDLSAVTGIPLDAATDLLFEYAVPVQQGRGKPSCTDLVVLTSETAMAIEAKYTEPEYESVNSWLRKPCEPNRLDVLNGWLTLINSATAREVKVNDVLELPYQLIHRSASACHLQRPSRAVVYLIFGETVAEHYINHAKRLDAVLNASNALPIFVLSCPVSALPQYHNVVQLWNAGQRKLSENVRQVLADGPAFTFGELRVSYVSPSAAGWQGDVHKNISFSK